MATRAKAPSANTEPAKTGRGRAPKCEADVKGRRYDPAETRLRILDAAYQLFATRGYVSTGTADIATLADVSEGSIFYHFGAKRNLLAELGKMRAQRMVLAMQEDDPLDCLPLTVSLSRCFDFCEGANQQWQESDGGLSTNGRPYTPNRSEAEPFFEAAKEQLITWSKAHLDAMVMRQGGRKFDTKVVAQLLICVVGEALHRYFQPDQTEAERQSIRTECIRFCDAAISAYFTDPTP